MLLGYIVSNEKIKLDNFEVVKTLPSDTNLPKLIVGLDFIRKSDIKISILNKNVSKNCFWTYSSKEKKSDYLEDLEKFKKHCTDNFLKNIKYFYIDPFNLKFSQVKKIINKFNKNTDGLFYYDSTMCYIYFDGIIFGLHWDSLEYFNIKKNKVIDYIKSKKFNTLPKDNIFNECMIESKDFNNKKIIPYLYYIKKYDKQNIIGNIS
jgi:hypothetical protein